MRNFPQENVETQDVTSVTGVMASTMEPTIRPWAGSNPDFTFETYDSLHAVPLDEVEAIVREQSEVMHDRVLGAGVTHNDPNDHVNAFMRKIERIVPPHGRKYLVRNLEGQVVACGAIRKTDETTAEMKHLYVRADQRGQNLARELVLRRLDDARAMGIKTVLADTIGAYPEMPTLYRSLGFVQVPPPETSGTLQASPQIFDILIFFRKDL
jgi:N-acetylglutamate synthase-like GNAT family acetyltransferase